jgi:hypothetical protein
MTDLMQRAREMKSIIDNAALSKGSRATQALQALSGLHLTGLPPDVRAALETNLVAVDRILQSYRLETDDDYEQMDDADLQKVLEILDSLVSRIVPAD